jgi:pimeloyl-ACP methyl ester carboxylesterase
MNLMPYITVNNHKLWYEEQGYGIPFIFVHGGFVDSSMWNPQIKYFSQSYRVITYDIRGHGKTGVTDRKKYSVTLYADDLKEFLDALNLEKPVICGLSLGGMIVQSFASRYPSRYSKLILADTAATITLTKWDYIMRYLVGPKWLMLLSLRVMGIKNMIKFQFWLAKKTRSKEWLGNKEIIEYEKKKMLKIDKKEYLKIFGSLYDFSIQKLDQIDHPTLIINGEHEPKSIFKHAEKMKSLIPVCEILTISNAGHVTNLENTTAFNQAIADFLGNGQ